MSFKNFSKDSSLNQIQIELGEQIIQTIIDEIKLNNDKAYITYQTHPNLQKISTYEIKEVYNIVENFIYNEYLVKLLFLGITCCSSITITYLKDEINKLKHVHNNVDILYEECIKIIKNIQDTQETLILDEN